MKTVQKIAMISLFWLSIIMVVDATSSQYELVTTTPIFFEGVLYVASTEYPLRRGHLRAIDIVDTFPLEIWDAAEKIPLAGDSPIQPEAVRAENQRRFLLTNAGGELIPLEAEQGAVLSALMDTTGPEEAALVLHATRGRAGGSLVNPAGNREMPYRLGGVSQSSPVLVGRSFVSHAASQRDQVIYTGAQDGMLHAFLVRRWRENSDDYPSNDQDGGTELWAYLPGSFLPHLYDQFIAGLNEEPMIHLDGSPVVGEFFVDLDGDGRRHWHTLLVGTGTVNHTRQSSLFVLDVTDPYEPAILWEKLLPGEGTGRTRGVTVARCSDTEKECLYLATDFRETRDSAGLHALAIELLTGELLWQFSTTYPARGEVFESTPAVPATMDLDRDNRKDTLIIGDLVGQLWALDIADGHAFGEAPVFTVANSPVEPIGAAVAVYGDTVVFGTGGTAGSSDQQEYALYKVKVAREGGELLWRFPLTPGVKVWSPPLLDARGNVIFTASTNYDSLLETLEETSGSILVLDKDGTQVSEHEVEGAVAGGMLAAPGLVIAVSVTGRVKQFGVAGRLAGPAENRGSVRVLSWRQR